MTWIIRLLLLVILLTVIRSLLARIFAPPPSRKVRPPDPAHGSRTISGRMVKDPQCGMYVASDLAVEARHDSQRLFFCSARCREDYLTSAVERRRK
jgi:YHS domain-containing protein